MKPLKHFALAALVIGGLLLPLVAARPQPASAGGVGTTLCQIISLGTACSTPFGEEFSCTLANLDVSATADGNQNSYKYDLNDCFPDAPTTHVSASYDFPTGKSVEKLTSAAFNLSAVWTCPHDPWMAPSALSCAQVSVGGGTTNGGTVADINGIYAYQKNGTPFSAQPLDDEVRQVLFSAQLQNAAQHPPTPAPLQVVEDPNIKAHECAICTALGKTSAPAPSIADLTALIITGPTTRQAGLSGTYTVTIKNQGGTAAPVELIILFAGKLNQTGQIVAGAGLACEVQAGDPGINTAVRCTGGTLTPGQSATVVVQARGEAPGTGTLVATIDPSHTVTESTYDNNLTQLAVTVN